MEIEVREIKLGTVNPFMGKLFINKVHVGDVHSIVSLDEVDKGPITFYKAKNEKGENLIQLAEEYFDIQPDIIFPPRFKQGSIVWKSSLRTRINEYIVNYFDEKDLIKFNKIIHREQNKAIVVGSRDKGHTTFPLNTHIDWVVKTDMGIKFLTLKLSEIRDGIIAVGSKNNLILNQNIPEFILKAAGFKKGEYVEPKVILPALLLNKKPKHIKKGKVL